MTDHDTPRDDEFVIVTPEEPAPEVGDEPAIPDGHGARPHRQFIETRERLSAVEQQVTQTVDVVTRVEGKVDGIASDLKTVEQKALDKDYFEENYKGTIETNDNVVTIAVWAGGVLLALIGVYATLYSAGVL